MVEIEQGGWRFYLPAEAPPVLEQQRVGKWMLFAGEATWKRVKEATAAGRITAVQAKTAARGSNTGAAPLIAVYTKDYTDLHNVLRVGLQLQQELGLCHTIAYKLDVQTGAGVYGNKASYYQLKGSSLVCTHTQQTLLHAQDVQVAMPMPVPGQRAHAVATRPFTAAALGHGAAQPTTAAAQAHGAAQPHGAAAQAYGAHEQASAAPAKACRAGAEQLPARTQQDALLDAAARRRAGEAAAARAARAALQGGDGGSGAQHRERLGDVIDLTED